MRQRMELTGTNRSCGLTTYFSQRRGLQELGRRRIERRWIWRSSRGDLSLQFESRREKVKAISNRDPSEDNACGCLFLVERSHSSECC